MFTAVRKSIVLNRIPFSFPKRFVSMNRNEDNTQELATICRITSISNIPKADSIESAKVLGWNCIVRKDQFKVGDLCIYFRISSIFPSGYHRIQESQQNKPIKTKKILGVISQGLVAPLRWLSEDFNFDITKLNEGDDVSEIFQLTKYIPPEEKEQYIKIQPKIGVDNKQPFPSFVPKTDEPRIQNIPEILEAIQDEEVVLTRKEDGCSATYVYRDGVFMVCGRNYWFRFGGNSERHYFHIAEKFNMEDRLKKLGKNIAIQGEIIGPSVNSNRMKLTALDYRVFYIIDIDIGKYLPYDEMVEVCKALSLPTVPLLSRGKANELEMMKSVDSLMDYANKLEYGANIPAEGLVVRVEKNNTGLSKSSFKVISNKYLIKNDL